MEDVTLDTNTIDASPDVVVEKTWNQTVIANDTQVSNQPGAVAPKQSPGGTSATTKVASDYQSSNFKYGANGWRLGSNGIIDAIGMRMASSASVGDGSNGVIIDENGLRGYNATLGQVFDLPTDGSAPSFANGTITESTFEINTNAVLRTSSTVGDGTANSAGVLINNTGMYGLGANQAVAGANVRIKTAGTLFVGNSTNYLEWDGTYLRLKGSFDVGTGGVINNSSYTVANLPAQPTIVGFNNPSANSAY